MSNYYTTRRMWIEEIPDDVVDQMAALYLDHFDGTSYTLFCNDLADKDEVILLYCHEELCGFTVLKIFSDDWNGRRVRIVYSGDTIVAPQHWGQQSLAFAWIARVGEIKREMPEYPLFWFLLVKGHRTFKYLSIFGKSFFPHWSEFRPDLKCLADQLAIKKFGSDYDANAGVVCFSESRGHLKCEIAEPTPEEMQRISTRFFMEKNPGYRLGHELVCLCELESPNMKPLAARIFNKASRAAGVDIS